MGIVLTMTLIIFGGNTHILYGTKLYTEYTNTSNLNNSLSLNQTSSLKHIPSFDHRGFNDPQSFQTSVSSSASDTDTVELNTEIPELGDMNKVSNLTNQTTSEGHRVCKARPDGLYPDFFDYVYPWIDTGSYFLLPALCISIGEAVIIHEIYKSRRIRRTMLQKDQKGKRRDRTSSVTIMLLTVNAVFIVCTTPISVFLIGMPYWTKTSKDHPRDSIAWAIVNLLMYLNHTVNFILYFLSGARFRRKLRELFSGKPNRRDSMASQHGTDTESSSKPTMSTQIREYLHQNGSRRASRLSPRRQSNDTSRRPPRRSHDRRHSERSSTISPNNHKPFVKPLPLTDIHNTCNHDSARIEATCESSFEEVGVGVVKNNPIVSTVQSQTINRKHEYETSVKESHCETCSCIGHM